MLRGQAKLGHRALASAQPVQNVTFIQPSSSWTTSMSDGLETSELEVEKSRIARDKVEMGCSARLS